MQQYYLITVFPMVILYFSLTIWIYLLTCHGRVICSEEPYFWSNKLIYEKIHKYHSNIKKNNNQRICILVPARNEEKTIKDTLSSLLQQKNIIFELILIDDESNDKTIQYALETFKHFKFYDYTIIRSKIRPRGWNGKVWALNQGVMKAIQNKENKFLLFLDADIVVEKYLLSNLLLTLKNKKLKMLSLMVKLNSSSIWEKILIPPFIYFFQKIYPFNIINNPKKNLAAAAGGCILCDINFFKEQNVFEIIKNKIIDDCNLAKEIKKKGTIWIGLSDKAKSIREYNDLKSIWQMISRCAFEQLNNSILLLFASTLFMTITYFSWIFGFLIALNTQSIPVYFLSLIIFLISSITIYPTINFYKLNPMYCFLIPISAGLYMMMTISSAFNFYFTNGNNWKGRRY